MCHYKNTLLEKVLLLTGHINNDTALMFEVQ